MATVGEFHFGSYTEVAVVERWVYIQRKQSGPRLLAVILQMAVVEG